MVRTAGWLYVFWSMVALVQSADVASAAGWRITVRGDSGELGETPVVAEIKARTVPPPGDYVLDAGGNAQKLRAQVFVDAGKTYLGTVLNRVPARGLVGYELKPESRSELTPPGIELWKVGAGANIEVLAAGKPWTVYLTDNGTKPTYFPVIGPTGAPITRAYPMRNVPEEDRDHPHQRSLWFTHGIVNGFDFWASDPLNKPNPKSGSIKETSRPTMVSGAAVGVIRTTDEWIGPNGSKVCDDERVVRFYDTTKGRVLDFDITIKATAGPVTFGDTKEGMFGFRVASTMDVKKKLGGKITNAEGINDLEAWGKASPWVDYTGPVEGKTVGIAIMNHPDSFRYPTTWHVRDYGLFAANPFGWHDFGRKEKGDHTIPAGGTMAFRYRVILHEGDTASANLPEAFRGYAEPPRIEVQAD